METPDHIAVLRGSGAVLADAARGHLDRPVPACPDWTVADLVRHVGVTHHFWRSIVTGEAAGPRDHAAPRPPDGDALLTWYREGLAETVRILADADPAEPRWTWAPRKDVAFIRRRVAQETLVHAWDAQDSRGGPEDLPSGAAADGIDEFLEVILPLGGAPRGAPGEERTTLRLRAVDTGDVWTVGRGAGAWRVRRSVSEGGWTVSPDPSPDTVAVEGFASDLLLVLWRRADTFPTRVAGDREAFARFLEEAETA
ncbi:maleylpyruvate isomerase family mycothiol-dependent enzyme [Nocardiopsis sp. CT-R113]|uniref:Maleylpyruvate isomerase family mycothiol-dependent enzyme n=1 Tax=Nocardiopsis codii TaxID=3065942 RepID=A0ABU7KG84_9ACTN|nr:maleylpyruvate isomerase family mycothiol-dependent enzyme [Nocardiopsis sp. CT-R113]MEE2040632.1 maleylpyruvate isomerase family mycothiol-dependent enzyme [Nocardiopsis sp. CT-R113]